MTRWRLHRWLLAPVAMACAVGLAVDRAGAQDQALVYEKVLDPQLNPTPVGSNDAGPPPAGLGVTSSGRSVKLPALVPDYDVDGGRSAQGGRVIEGTPAPAGKWKSAVNIKYGFTFNDGQDRASSCGASLIDERWVLTAAHCVFRVQLGGLRTLKWVTAYANDVRFQSGVPLRVKAVYVHRAYDEAWILNDVALLELENPTALPRQKLAAGAGQASFLAAGNAATIVGWGLTEPWWQPGTSPGGGSPVLLEATVPIANKAGCDAFRAIGWGKPGRPLGDADFCAGRGDGTGPLTCNGDSGGPIFVANATGEHIQTGIVSWGRRGCPSIYAAYANVGYFEPWIRKHVPNAVFVMPGAASSPVQQALQQIAGAEAGGLPSPHGQCSVDIRADGATTNRVRVGSELTVQVTTGVSGHLAVFNRTSADKKVQLFPNRFGGRDGTSPTAVRAGDAVSIPGPADNFSLKVSPPLGRYELVAVVVPEGVNLADITRPFEDMGRIDDFDAVLARIADETRQVAADAPGAPRAVCTRQFEVVQ